MQELLGASASASKSNFSYPQVRLARCSGPPTQIVQSMAMLAVVAGVASLVAFAAIPCCVTNCFAHDKELDMRRYLRAMSLPLRWIWCAPRRAAPRNRSFARELLLSNEQERT